MSEEIKLGGKFTLSNGPAVYRLGYGAMQLAGPGVFGPPKDKSACIAVLRAAVDAGVDHIDTSDFYGPHITNQLIREALHPYPAGLTIVTKVGAKRGADKSWNPAMGRQDLIDAVHDNLRNLGLDALDVVNLRAMGGEHGMGISTDQIAEPLSVLAELQQKGLIRHIGLSNVSFAHLREAGGIADIVCVQNLYNLAHREDDAFIEELNGAGIAYVPFFPLGGFTPLQSAELNVVAEELHRTPMQIALAWLLHRSPNILLIPGTSNVDHLHENLAAAEIELTPEAIAKLDKIGTPVA